MSASFVLASLRGSPYGGKARQSTYPLASDGSERFKRSLVCTYSPPSSLRPRLRRGASWRAGVGRVGPSAILSIL